MNQHFHSSEEYLELLSICNNNNKNNSNSINKNNKISKNKSNETNDNNESNKTSSTKKKRRKESLPLQKKYSLCQQTAKGLRAKYGTIFLPMEKQRRKQRKNQLKNPIEDEIKISPVPLCDQYFSPKQVKADQELIDRSVRDTIRNNTKYKTKRKKILSKILNNDGMIINTINENTQDSDCGKYTVEMINPFNYTVKCNEINTEINSVTVIDGSLENDKLKYNQYDGISDDSSVEIIGVIEPENVTQDILNSRRRRRKRRTITTTIKTTKNENCIMDGNNNEEINRNPYYEFNRNFNNDCDTILSFQKQNANELKLYRKFQMQIPQMSQDSSQQRYQQQYQQKYQHLEHHHVQSYYEQQQQQQQQGQNHQQQQEQHQQLQYHHQQKEQQCLQQQQYQHHHHQQQQHQRHHQPNHQQQQKSHQQHQQSHHQQQQFHYHSQPRQQQPQSHQQLQQSHQQQQQFFQQQQQQQHHQQYQAHQEQQQPYQIQTQKHQYQQQQQQQQHYQQHQHYQQQQKQNQQQHQPQQSSLIYPQHNFVDQTAHYSSIPYKFPQPSGASCSCISKSHLDEINTQYSNSQLNLYRNQTPYSYDSRGFWSQYYESNINPYLTGNNNPLTKYPSNWLQSHNSTYKTSATTHRLPICPSPRYPPALWFNTSNTTVPSVLRNYINP